MLIPGKRSQGLVITCLIGVAGALLGGWLATKLFHVVTLHGFFNRQRSRGWAHRSLRVTRRQRGSGARGAQIDACHMRAFP
jgi:hypothetical protein